MASNDFLVRKLIELDDQVKALTRGGIGLGHSSLASGETLDFIGNSEIKLTEDGIDYVQGPPPPKPTAPILSAGVGSVFATWDGQFDEVEVLEPVDDEPEDYLEVSAPLSLDVIEVHCSTDPLEEEWGEDTLQGQIKSRDGGTVMVRGGDVDDTVYVVFIALNKTGERGFPSTPTSIVIEGIDIASITNELDAATTTIANAGEILVEGQTTLGDKLTAADSALDELRDSLADLDETTLPALSAELDAAKARLSGAEGDIGDAFGELALIPGKINDAKAEAEADATAKANAAQSAAEAAAQALVDAIESGASPADIEALQNYADAAAEAAREAAETAAQAKADAALEAAKSDASGKIATARQEAIDAAHAELEVLEGTLTTALDEKTSTKWSTSDPPSSYTGAVGDTWVKLTSLGTGGREIARNKWDGSKWTVHKVDGASLSNIDASTIEAGFLDVANRIRSGSIFADKLLVGAKPENLIYDVIENTGALAPHVLEDGAATFLRQSGSADGDGVNPGEHYFITTTSGPVAWRYIVTWAGSDGTTRLPVSPNTPYLLSSLIRAGGGYPNGLPRIQWVVREIDSAGAQISLTAFGAGTPLSWNWVSLEEAFTTSPGAKFVEISMRAQTGSAGVRIGLPSMREQVGGTLITPGGIQTPHLAADVLEVGNLKAGTGEIAEVVSRKIAAATGQFIKLDVGNLTVTGSSVLADVVAERIAGSTARFIELEVGNLTAGTAAISEAVVQKLFSEVVVAQTVISDAFIGENAILTGAVTAPKITAGAITTAKLDALAVTADKIAVNAITADKIDANAITAGKIKSDAIDGMTITGALIRSNATGARTQQSDIGIEVYNSANVRTFYASAINGSLSIIGDLSTDVTSKERVILTNSLWQSIQVPDENGSSLGTAPGAGVRVGLSSTSGIDIYHATKTATYATSDAGMIRGPAGKTSIGLRTITRDFGDISVVDSTATGRSGSMTHSVSDGGIDASWKSNVVPASGFEAPRTSMNFGRKGDTGGNFNLYISGSKPLVNNIPSSGVQLKLEGEGLAGNAGRVQIRTYDYASKDEVNRIDMYGSVEIQSKYQVALVAGSNFFAVNPDGTFSGLPIATGDGVDFAGTLAAGSAFTKTVNFPSGKFKSPPSVSAMTSNGKILPVVFNITKDSFSFRVWNISSSSTSSIVGTWMAVMS